MDAIVFKEHFDRLNERVVEIESNMPSREELRNRLSRIGAFIQINKLSMNEIADLSNGAGVVGVDGSLVSMGSSFPDIIYLIQALAKATNSKDKGVFLSHVESPIFYTSKEDLTKSADFIHKDASDKMAKMEVLAAHTALEQYNPFITLFDGGFFRLNHQAEKEFENFRMATLSKNSLAVGIIEDIGSYELWKNEAVNSNANESNQIVSDSTLLFNILDKGEVFICNEAYLGFPKAYARFSEDPKPIACDFLPEQKDRIVEILRFVYSITAEKGRGIPYWIDIVDQEVKITYKETEILMNNYLSPVVREKVFNQKRNKR